FNMKKILFEITTLATVLSVSAGITSFAGWVLDETGQYMWQLDSGTGYVYAGWVTDPETGYQYYMDPDGHIMTNTRVDGYWLDDQGIKHEKTEAEIQAEEAREARQAAKPSPSKVTNAVNELATAAKSATSAVSTTRRSFQAEMYTFTDTAFAAIKKSLETDGNTSFTGGTTKNNLTNKFYYNMDNGTEIISSDMPKAAANTDAYYEYALEIHYNRNLVHDGSAPYFDSGFQTMVIAALGEEAGTEVYEQVMAAEVGSDTSFTLSGLTATGNSYTARYSTNNAYIQVTCSEIVVETAEEETTEETTEEAGAETTVEEATEDSAETATTETEASTEEAVTEETEEEAEEETSEEETEAAVEETVEETETEAEEEA
ncbi:MAG: hypothetical protein LIO92_07540, partial [Clostridiales bacterium]|nr:hypothetical protein [Clostridiales bacterium]